MDDVGGAWAWWLGRVVGDEVQGVGAGGQYHGGGRILGLLSARSEGRLASASLVGAGKMARKASRWRKADLFNGDSDPGTDSDSGDKAFAAEHRLDEWHLTSRGLHPMWMAAAAAAGGPASAGFWRALRSS